MGTSSLQFSCWDCSETLLCFQPACDHCGAGYEWEATMACPVCNTPTEALDGECDLCGVALSPWRVVEADVTADGPPVSIWKDAVERPSRAGYRRHLGSLKGQWADYRRVLDDGTEFHVREFTDRYEIHRDEVSAMDDPAMHLLRYTPQIMVATAGTVTLGVLDTLLYSSQLMNDAVQSSVSLLPGGDE